MHSFMRPQ